MAKKSSEKRGRGRPIAGEQPMTGAVYIRLTPDIREAVEKYMSAERHVRISDGIRGLLLEALRQRGLLK